MAAQSESLRLKSDYDKWTFCLRNKSFEEALGSILGLNDLSHDAFGPMAQHEVLVLVPGQKVCASQKLNMNCLIVLGKFKPLEVI